MIKKETDKILEEYLNEIEDISAKISGRLEKLGVDVEGFFVEHWPIFSQEKTLFKIWDGVTHTKPVDNKSAMTPSWLTRRELSEVASRRTILKRKF